MAEKLINEYDKVSPVVEAYRALRINLQFAGAGKKLQVIGVTSSHMGEGKSTTIANLAIVMAQDQKKVLLIDCDLRKPTQHKKFEIEQIGVVNHIVKGKGLDELIQRDVVPNLDILASGPIPPNPAELLAAESLQKIVLWAKDEYDYVLIDLPPVLAVSDASVLGRMTDGILLVVASGEVSPDEVQEAKKRLLQTGINILGVVLNKMPNQKRYGYYHYNYYESRQ